MNRARARSGGLEALAALAALAGACTPDVGSNSVPTTVMQFDTTATPPRVPQPTLLVINPATGKIDFEQAGMPIPADCATQTAMPEAECEFDQYLQTLNGFPSLSVASAPANAALDPATVTLGTNVFMMDAQAQSPVTDVVVKFDDASNSITVTPTQPLKLGELYWVGVRGYGGGVLDAAGGEVLGSPTMSLLKQDTSLTCDAQDAASLDPRCPGFEVVAQAAPTPEAAAMQVFQLEAARMAYVAGHGFDLMAAVGLPKEGIAVLWGFPIHTNSVPLLVPNTAATPRVLSATQIAVGVQGPVDPTTVTAFIARVQNGSVVVMDLTAAAGGDLNAAFLTVGAVYQQGAIVIGALAPFPAGHQIGLFFTNKITSPDHAPLVASPVSVLLSRHGSLLDSGQHSTVSVVGDADAAALEAGRAALAPLFDNPIFTPLTGVSRDNIVYCYAFVPMVQP